tara:strand:+ start:8948 stop:10642 length:1695 start_codon:yes stop_codon:yes gene_type:complete
MYNIRFIYKLILRTLFITIFFSALQAKNLDKFDKASFISDYFSGLILLNDNQYSKSYSFFKKLDGLENSHPSYSVKYLHSLVNLGRFNEAFNYSKKLEKTGLSNYESDLITGIYYLKNKNYFLANRYFSNLNSYQDKSLLDDYIINSLLNWSDFSDLSLSAAKKRIDLFDPRFENLKRIQNIFLHCFFRSSKTELYFEDLTLNKKIDFSRYNYFHAKHLSNRGKYDEAKMIINSSLKLYPRNLLLNQLKLDLINGKNRNEFNCENLTDVVAEIFYISANALSSQNLYKISNFYLNLAKFLNKNFYSYDTLLAENFFKINNFDKAKKIYTDIGRNGEAFLWYSAKQNSKILIEENKDKKALKLIKDTFEKLSKKDIYETYDYARFLKNNDKFEESIEAYTSIIKKINETHPLYPDVTDGRGVSYERIGEWEKAEKDLLASLKASPDQAYVINYLAYSWIEQGVKIEKSLKMLEKANNLKSNDPYIIDSLGWALFKLKRYKDSKLQLQSAVELMPADPVVNDHYGDALWMNGEKLQARYYWKYVLSLKDVEDEMKKRVENKLTFGL